MASDENNPGGWKVPKGYTLTRYEGYHVDGRGLMSEGSDPRHGLMADGRMEVPHFVESEPFVWEENDGRGAFASIEAKKAALEGNPIAGWNPNVVLLPIEDSWMPPQFVLTHDEDPTPKIEPASVLADSEGTA
jgi:hypothetical protein